MRKKRNISAIFSPILSALLLLAILFAFSSCESIEDILNNFSSSLDSLTASESEESSITNVESSESESTSESTEQNTESGTEDSALEYFVASINKNSLVNVSLYTEGNEPPSELQGLYYSSNAPGGEPRGDGEGSIWLELKPTKKYGIDKIDIAGEYTKIESLGKDIYRIDGVSSNLVISLKTKTLPDLTDRLLKGYGYGISEDGVMCVSWEQSEDNPLRYVEVTYPQGTSLKVEYIDAGVGTVELFKMTENKDQTVTMRAISEKGVGKRVTMTGHYMPAPRDVAFPRVEITTQGFALPTFEKVNSPDGCWGQGITNATYEQCVMTIYNENDEIVYTSSEGRSEAQKYLGAKMRVRGNVSAAQASNERYPYKVKLDEKFDLLEPLIGRADDGKSYADKDWLLLNYGDEAFRPIGEAIADAVGTEWTPEYCYVTLYLNGEYRGLYVLSEAVERSGTGEESGRIGTEADGFVFECDAYWWNEDVSFSTPMTENTPMHFTFKYPSSDDLTEQSPELLYLKNYMTEFEEALARDDDSYLDYIDLDSFVKWLLVADYLCIEDSGGSNIFLYKEDSTGETKVKMGPNWDLDSYMCGVNALATIRMYWKEAPFYIHQLIKKDSFMERYRELYNETRDKLSDSIDSAISKIDTEAHEALLEYDNARFGTPKTTLDEQVQEFYEFLEPHLDYMDGLFGE